MQESLSSPVDLESALLDGAKFLVAAAAPNRFLTVSKDGKALSIFRVDTTAKRLDVERTVDCDAASRGTFTHVATAAAIEGLYDPAKPIRYRPVLLPEGNRGREIPSGDKGVGVPLGVFGRRLALWTRQHLLIVSLDDDRLRRTPWSYDDCPSLLGFENDLLLLRPYSRDPLKPGVLGLWKLDGEELKLLRTLEAPGASLSPGARYFLTAGADRKWHVERLADGVRVFEGYVEELRLQSAAWSPSQRYLAFTLPRRLYVVDLEHARFVGFPEAPGRVVFLDERRFALVHGAKCSVYEILP